MEQVIAKYDPIMQAIIDEYKPRLEGKKVMLLVGGLRPRHTVSAYEDLGMDVRRLRLRVRPQRRLRPHRPGDARSHGRLRRPSEYEFEQFAHALKPDLIGSGIKEKYVFQKMGIPFRQMHSWDYSGPYHGYLGFSSLCPGRRYGGQQPDLETGQRHRFNEPTSPPAGAALVKERRELRLRLSLFLRHR